VAEKIRSRRICFCFERDFAGPPGVFKVGWNGFSSGDEILNYGRENIVETYYTLHAWRGIYPSLGLQHINNPGYNRDRGPVIVPTLRLHLEL